MSLDLEKLEGFTPRRGPLLFIVMDGVGIGKRDESDGVFLADTPCLDALMQSDLYTQLQAHGTAVGMPSDEDMGNSEVGHNAIGAGRVFAQGAKLVQNSIDDGSIFQTETWEDLIQRGLGGATVHFIGLLSDGNVHSHIEHLFAMVRECAHRGVKTVRVHALLDGRDVYEKSAVTYIERTEETLTALNQAHGTDYAIASGGGRMVTTMDRYNADWDVVKAGWEAHVLGQARGFASAREAVETYYAEDPEMTDQYMASFVVIKDGAPVGPIQDGDGVIFFNFRGDRAIELSEAFEAGHDFTQFDRQRVPEVLFAGMMEYDGDLHVPRHYLVNPPQIDRSVSEYMCVNDITSFALSETQKFGHVTYFWNGNKSGYICKEQELFVEIPSDKIQFDKAPKMKALEITDKAEELLRSGKWRFGRINFANGDMVGHTGKPEAVKVAVSTVDACVARLIDVVVKDLGGIVVISADHGNSDELYTEKNGKRSVSTAHSLNPVPFAIVDAGYDGEYRMADLKKRGLSNIASTLLNLLGLEAPKDYDPSLISLK